MVIDLLPGDSQLMKGEYGNGELPRVISKVCLVPPPKQSKEADWVELGEPLSAKLEEVMLECIRSSVLEG